MKSNQKINKLAGLLAAIIICSNCIAAESQAEDSYPAGMLAARAAGSEQRIFIPLKKTEIHMQVSGGIVATEVTQEFKNETGDPLEAVYVYPLPSEGTVTGMVMQVGDRIIQSIVREKQEAREIYEEAVASGKRAALVEQQRPNIFTNSVANIMPGDTLLVKLTLMHTADYREGVYSVTFPLVVGPRYLPFNIPVPDANEITPPLLHPRYESGHRVQISASVEGLPVERIDSSTHAIHVAQASGGNSPYAVELATGPVRANRDFHLDIHLTRSEMPRAELVVSDEDDRHGMLTLLPPVATELRAARRQVPRDVLFLIDTSGSMSGESIAQARAGLRRCLNMLQPQDHFTIVRFADDYSSFSPDLRLATDERVEAARMYVDGLEADGGTEMQKALAHLLSIPGTESSMRLVVFLTDGSVGNEESLMQLLHARLGTTRMFTFGIGSAPNEYLMRAMADAGRGQTRFIRSHEDIGEVMSDFFRTLEAPVMTDINIEWLAAAGDTVADVEWQPQPIPDVFHERPVRIFAYLPHGTVQAVRLSAKVDGQQKVMEVPLAAATISSSAPLGKLFGRGKISRLMLDYTLATEDAQRERLKAEVTGLGLKYQLLTQFTSRVAVEQVVANPSERLKRLKVPTELPAGWQANSFFPTATNDPLLLVISAIFILFAMVLIGLWEKARYTRRIERSGK